MTHYFRRRVRWLHGSADSFEVEFKAEVPAFAPRAYYLELAKPARQPDPFVIADSKDTERNWANQPLGKLSAENEFLRLEIDRATGRLSLFSKQEERCLFRDAEISGIEEMRGDYICNMPRTGRVVPAVADSIEIAEHTTVVCRFVIRGTVYGLPFEQKIAIADVTGSGKFVVQGNYDATMTLLESLIVKSKKKESKKKESKKHE